MKAMAISSTTEMNRIWTTASTVHPSGLEPLSQSNIAYSAAIGTRLAACRAEHSAMVTLERAIGFVR